MTDLFSPLRLGDLELPNRIFLAPLTRARAGAQRLPNSLMAEYYRQRASAGLMLTEATVVSPMGVGYANTPGIYSREQIEGWRRITRAVHETGGRIFLQLWHVGRISHPRLLDGALPLAPSAIAPAGRVMLLRPEESYVVPHALERVEIAQIVEQFRQGARNAQAAGFDGVELHGANGYLFDQFLQGKSNRRTDDYGGSIENRARLLLEATDAVVSVWGRDRVGVHLSPRGDVGDLGDSDPTALFTHVASELHRRGIAFIAVREHTGPGRIGPQLRQCFGGIYVANEGFDLDSGTAIVATGEADAVAFGQLFLANPDLPQRFRLRAPLNAPDVMKFYSDGAAGYTDYPALDGLRIL